MENYNVKIKILIVLNTLGFGGAEVQLARTIPFFDKDRYDIQVAYYSRCKTGHPEKLLEDAGVKVTFFDRDKWGRFRYFLRATRFMRANQFDIVFAWTGTANFYARIPALIAGVPCILGGLLGRRTADGLRGLIYSLTNWRCSGWIVNAHEIKEIAQKKLFFIKNSPIYVVPNGVDAVQTGFPDESHVFYQNLKTGRPVVGAVSRLVPIKNHKLFLEMARELLLQGVPADFWIVGDGPLKDALQLFIDQHHLNKHVKLLGYRTDVDLALCHMDILVLTSDSEGCPNVLLEAMRASLPVVSTNCSSLQEIIEEAKNGFLVPVGDSKALAEKVRWILENPGHAKQMGTYSKKIIDEKFLMNIAVDRLEHVFLDCLKKNMVKYPNLKNKLKQLGMV